MKCRKPRPKKEPQIRTPNTAIKYDQRKGDNNTVMNPSKVAFVDS
jgi:hypothetical protein